MLGPFLWPAYAIKALPAVSVPCAVTVGHHEIHSHQTTHYYRWWTQDQHLSRRCVLEQPEGNRAQGASVSQTVREIDETRQYSNLSSAVRLFVLDRVRSKK